MPDANFSSLPPEYLAEVEKARRLQAMAQALFQQGATLQQPQAGPGGIVPKISPFQGLAQALQMYMANRTGNEATGQIGEIQGRAEGEKQAELARVLAAPPEQRLDLARGSRWPQVQGMAPQFQKQLEDEANRVQKRLELMTGAVKEYAPESAAQIAATGSLSTPVPAMAPPEITTGQLGETPYVLLKDRGKTTFHGLRPPSRVSATASSSGGVFEKESDKALAHEIPKVLETARNAIITGRRGFGSAQRILELASDPEVITGFAADPLLIWSRFGALVGLGSDAPAAKTQTLMSNMAKQTLEAAKDLKGSVSEKEYPFLYAASTGNLSYEPKAIQALARELQALNANIIMEAQRQYQGAASQLQNPAGTAMYPLPNFQAPEWDPTYFNVNPQSGYVEPKSLAAPGAKASKWKPPPGVTIINEGR